MTGIYTPPGVISSQATSLALSSKPLISKLYGGGNQYHYTEYSPEKLILSTNCFFGPIFIIRKDVWQKHRGKISHDYDNWLRVEEACWKEGLDIIGVDEDLCYYRVHDKRVTVTRRHQFDASQWQLEAEVRRAVSEM